jgi:threonyl-tRNA synthetase
VEVIPITQQQHEYAQQITRQLREQGIRVETDLRNEKMGLKIREAQLAKIPYMLITGDKEVKARTVSVRRRSEGDTGERSLADFITTIQEEIRTRAIQQPEF